MTEMYIISILLSIVGFIGVLMVNQLVKIANAVSGIQTDLKVLTNDHSNLKENVKEVEKRVEKLEYR